MLTNIVDVDKKIFYGLTLHQLQEVCAIDQYTHNLCQNDIFIQKRLKEANVRANHFIEEIKNRHGLTLNFKNAYFEQLNYIFKFYIPDMENNGFNAYNIDYITVTKHNIKKSVYKYVLYISMSKNKIVDGISDSITTNELYQFLRHAFYDNLILTI